MLSVKFTFLALLICLKYASSFSNVPLLMWTNTRGVSCQKSTYNFKETVTSLFTEDFMKCLSKKHPQRVVIFVYDQLGIEDITRYGQTNENKSDSFFNLKSSMEQYESLMIPAVEPSNILEDLLGKFDKISKNIRIEVVHLPSFDRTDSSSIAKGFKRADEKIVEDINTIEGNYIAIVTSESPSTDVKLRYTRDTGRHLLSSEDAQSSLVYLISDCVLMTFESVNMSVTPKTSASKKTYTTELILNDPNSTDFSQVSCLPSNTTSGVENVTIDFKATTPPILTAQIQMVFNKSFYGMSFRYWWRLSEVYVTYTTNSSAVPNQTRLALNPYLFENVIAAPAEFSFVCANTTGLAYIDVSTKSTSPNNTDVNIQFNRFQVQPFLFNSSTTFSEASDCVGWYTGPIWSGLIVSFLLLLILSYGICMLSYVTTMDRFDDPKGKTMTVPQEST